MQNKMRELRFFQKKTLDDLWLATKIHQSKLSLIERGYYEPSAKEMGTIAKALRRPIKEIFFPKAGRNASATER